jgi:DNA (cytosine-5)-methyltransferase 1
MVNYSCSNCQKIFKQKGHYEFHMNRKTPCKKDNTIERLVEEKVREALRKKDKVITFIDLFCGLGAFHTAFKDFKCVLACDIDEGVRNIYTNNYGLTPHGDIRNLKNIPDFDILCAGFPCQPVSIAGNGEGFNDIEKGNLFFDILRIIDEKNPPMCILENVKNLKTHDNGNTYSTIKSELEKRGYIVTSKIMNSANYGSPQARHRIFIIASKKPFKFPNETKRYTTVSEIIDPLNSDEWISDKYSLVEKCSKLIPGKPHILYDVILAKNGKGGRQGERVYGIDSVGVTVCASSGGPGAKTGLYKVGEKIRRLSVKETTRMFGFPDDYKFNVSSENALFYLGNSIVVNVVEALLPEITRYFRSNA